MEMSKISQLSASSLGGSDFVPVSRGTANYKLNLSGAIGSYIESNSSYDGSGLGIDGKLVRYSANGHISGEYLAIGQSPNQVTLDPLNYPFRMTTTNSDVAIEVNGGVYQGWTYADGPTVNTYLSREYLVENTLPLSSQALNTGAYIYNTGNLSLSDIHNGKIIISNNSSSALYTVTSGLISPFSCKIIRNNSGTVSISGAAGVSVNSFGGYSSIAGRYGVANLHYTALEAYVLEGDLSVSGGVAMTPQSGYAEFTDGVNTVYVPTVEI